MTLIDTNLAGKLEPLFVRMREFEINDVTPFAFAPHDLADKLTRLAHGLSAILEAAEHDARMLDALEHGSQYGSMNTALRKSGPEAVGALLEYSEFFRSEEWRAMHSAARSPAAPVAGT